MKKLVIFVGMLAIIGLSQSVDAQTSGSCGDGVNWELTGTAPDQTLTISYSGVGTGVINDFSDSNRPPYYASRLNIKTIVIEEGITVIGAYAFSSGFSTGTLQLPQSLISIRNLAFFALNFKGDLIIPNSVTSIGWQAFSYCNFQTLTLGNSVTTITGYAFSDCRNLTSVTIPKSVLSISSSAFSGCSGIASITCKAIFPPTIDPSSFSGVPSTVEVIIPCQTLTYYQNSNWKNSFTSFKEDEDCSWIQQKTIYFVKAGGTGDGSSWTNAAGNIQDMINASVSGRGDQVWIAGGTYLLSATLQMKVGVNVYGGFLGDETDIKNRSKSDKDGNGTIEPWEFTNATILDGQNGRQVLNQARAFELETIWDGVTITKGKYGTGAGAYIRANGKLNNCIVTQNRATSTDTGSTYGGGLYNDGGEVSNSKITNNVVISDGSRLVGGAGFSFGGGIYNIGRVIGCVVEGNSCTFSNSSKETWMWGGGIYNKEGDVINCTVENNVCSVGGHPQNSRLSGGIHNAGGIVNSCCITNNYQGITNDHLNSTKMPLIYCSTILNNSVNSIYAMGEAYCFNCITENSDLEQNFIRPTSFVGQASDDAQRAELLRADWRLKQGSQYIETGSLTDLPDWVINGIDLAGNPRVSNGKISMGAYEFDPTVNNAIKLTHFDSGLKIYPNPVRSSFIVDYEGFIQVKIYDMLGKEILSQDTNGKTEININHLSKGIYNVNVISGGRIIGNSKIVKQ